MFTFFSVALVVYDGCPRSSSESIWWPRTNFGLTAIESCPKGAHGKASRSCDNLLGGWQPPDMFNCTSDRFVDLRTQVSHTKNSLYFNKIQKLQILSLIIMKVFVLKQFLVLQLSLIESGELQLNTFVAIKLASDLRKATNLTLNLYGADVLITYDLITALLKYEATLFGLNLTHSQDKDYISVSSNIFLIYNL